MIEPSTLYCVATPIGNLGDLSKRALNILNEVDVIVCEDTRVSARLKSESQSKAALVSCHKFNEKSKIDDLLNRLKSGQSLALVSDAGTPAISDPGFYLVAKVHDEGFKVCPIPGPSAVSSLCSIMGMDASRHFFAGFFPRKNGEREELLLDLSSLKCPVIFFESPNRIEKTILWLQMHLPPETIICLGKELTKKHESIIRCSLSQVLDQFKKLPSPKGEWVVAIEGAQNFSMSTNTNGKNTNNSLELNEICTHFKIHKSLGAKILALITKKKKSDFYN